MNDESRFDALLPPDMARRAEAIGVAKSRLDTATTFVLAVLAGAFIALGALFATTVMAGASGMLPYGVIRLLGGFVFSLGLVLVVVGGAELFTGNTLIVMAWASGRIGIFDVLRNWTIVFAGNLVGAVATAAIAVAGKQYTFGDNAVGETAMAIAVAKVQLGFVQGVALGTLGNALVCLAVWLTLSARSTTDRVVSVLFPISAFVAAGFEHSVANMYFVPVALFIRDFASPGTGLHGGDQVYAALTWGGFIVRNLLPVTLGNIIGGGVMVGAVYWFVYLRGSARAHQD